MKNFYTVVLISIVLAIIFIYSIVSVNAPTREVINKISDERRNSITIGWVGDMVPTLDASYNQNVFNDVSLELKKPDLMIGNLEGTFASVDRKSKCSYLLTMCHAFRGDASFAVALKKAGFDLVSLVNNHAFDYGDNGLTDTELELQKNSMASISFYSPSISLTIKNKTVGILGLSSTKPTVTIADYDYIENKIKDLKKSNDFVIVIFHGGAEGADKTLVPGKTEYVGTENRGNVEKVAHLAIDSGADLILGSGPHVLRKIEVYKGVPIAYSMGNFVGGKQQLITTGNLSLSGIFFAELEKNKPTAFDFNSVILSRDGIPRLDPLDQGLKLIKSL